MTIETLVHVADVKNVQKEIIHQTYLIIALKSMLLIRIFKNWIGSFVRKLLSLDDDSGVGISDKNKELLGGVVVDDL